MMQGDIAERLGRIDWQEAARGLDADGHAVVGPLIDAGECAALAALFADDGQFRRRINMGRHGYGEGDYAYFDRPLPPPVDALRRGLYPPLAAIASDMAVRLGRGDAYPPELDTWLAACHAGGQAKPTPLLLRYAAGGWNALHRDLYGPLHFPLQATVLLSDPDRDFDGGEFLLVENRPRRQARGEAVRLGQGEAVLFPTWERPVRGARGWIRAEMRHGVSRVRSGERYTLGLIFHDAA